jgi:hypothetical protein
MEFRARSSPGSLLETKPGGFAYLPYLAAVHVVFTTFSGSTSALFARMADRDLTFGSRVP